MVHRVNARLSGHPIGLADSRTPSSPTGRRLPLPGLGFCSRSGPANFLAEEFAATALDNELETGFPAVEYVFAAFAIEDDADVPPPTATSPPTAPCLLLPLETAFVAFLVTDEDDDEDDVPPPPSPAAADPLVQPGQVFIIPRTRFIDA
eukprot:gene27460-4766_t